MTELFPIFVNLRGRKVLVVGAGPIGASKAESLLRAGAEVQVVSPVACKWIEEQASAGKLQWDGREFTNEDLRDVFLCVAATDSESTNHAIFEEARRRHVLWMIPITATSSTLPWSVVVHCRSRFQLPASVPHWRIACELNSNSNLDPSTKSGSSKWDSSAAKFWRAKFPKRSVVRSWSALPVAKRLKNSYSRLRVGLKISVASYVAENSSAKTAFPPPNQNGSSSPL